MEAPLSLGPPEGRALSPRSLGLSKGRALSPLGLRFPEIRLSLLSGPVTLRLAEAESQFLMCTQVRSPGYIFSLYPLLLFAAQTQTVIHHLHNYLLMSVFPSGLKVQGVKDTSGLFTALSQEVRLR